MTKIKITEQNKQIDNKKVIEFLKESNAIENEFRSIALDDAKKAWEFAIGKDSNNIDIQFIKDIHKILCCNINPHIAGEIRQCPVYVGSYIKGYKEMMDYHLIEKELGILCDKWNNFQKLNCDKNGKMITDKKNKFIIDWHIKFEECHPFSDGNGRTGRIILNFQRVKLGLPLMIIHSGKEQMKYYKLFEGKKK
jgi:Fic family protein